MHYAEVKQDLSSRSTPAMWGLGAGLTLLAWLVAGVLADNQSQMRRVAESKDGGRLSAPAARQGLSLWPSVLRYALNSI